MVELTLTAKICKMSRKFEDISDKTFGRLNVISRVENNKHNQIMWNCICECGNKRVIYGGDLKSGKTKSCGCLNKELIIQRSKTHGLSSHPIYKIWVDMKDRCDNPNNKGYKYYGQRDIKLSKNWESRNNFFIDMLSSWEEGLTIDRINNNLGYSKENCKWSTDIEQARNTRANISVIGRDKNTNKIVCIYKIMEDAKYDGYDPGCISRCLSGKHKSHKGLIWSKI